MAECLVVTTQLQPASKYFSRTHLYSVQNVKSVYLLLQCSDCLTVNKHAVYYSQMENVLSILIIIFLKLRKPTNRVLNILKHKMEVVRPLKYSHVLKSMRHIHNLAMNSTTRDFRESRLKLSRFWRRSHSSIVSEPEN